MSRQISQFSCLVSLAFLRGTDPMRKKTIYFNQLPDPEFFVMLDPKVRTNMLRYAMAFRKVLTGQWEDGPDLKVKIGTGFTMSDETDHEYQRQTLSDGCDRLYIRFDIEDPLGPPDGLGLVRAEKSKAILYGQCRLWIPTGTARASIVFQHEGRVGHFVYVAGRPLIRMDTLPAKNLSPGFGRASMKLDTLVASKRLRKIRVGRLVVKLDDTKAE